MRRKARGRLAGRLSLLALFKQPPSACPVGRSRPENQGIGETSVGYGQHSVGAGRADSRGSCAVWWRIRSLEPRSGPRSDVSPVRAAPQL
jgi:hypothetical protein